MARACVPIEGIILCYRECNIGVQYLEKDLVKKLEVAIGVTYMVICECQVVYKCQEQALGR